MFKANRFILRRRDQCVGRCQSFHTRVGQCELRIFRWFFLISWSVGQCRRSSTDNSNLSVDSTLSASFMKRSIHLLSDRYCGLQITWKRTAYIIICYRTAYNKKCRLPKLCTLRAGRETSGENTSLSLLNWRIDF